MARKEPWQKGTNSQEEHNTLFVTLSKHNVGSVCGEPQRYQHAKLSYGPHCEEFLIPYS